MDFSLKEAAPPADTTKVAKLINVRKSTRARLELARSTPFPDLGRDGTPSLVFQPAVDLATGRLLGFEALLRWHDASGNEVPPQTLIPWAESHGHMNALNAWVLSEACAQATRWPGDLQLAVNCSTLQLRPRYCGGCSCHRARTIQAQPRPLDRRGHRGLGG